MNIQILGIAVTDPFAQKAFADSLKLPYPLLADHPEPKTTQRYGVLREHPKEPGRMIARRAFFLIDKDGLILGRWLVDNRDVFPSEPILAKVREAMRNDR